MNQDYAHINQRLHEAIQALYDSEINFLIANFWDGGFDVKLGDQLNGFKACGNEATWAEAVYWLAERACEHFPKSTFAEWWQAMGGTNEDPNSKLRRTSYIERTEERLTMAKARS